MKSLSKVLREIKDVASVSVSLYSLDGQIAINADSEGLVDGIAERAGTSVLYENGNTYFVLNVNSMPYVVKIEGEQTFTVTALVSQLIRNVEVEDFDSLSNESKLRRLLLGELSDIRKHEVKNLFKSVDYFTLAFITETLAKQTELENFLETVKGKDDIIVRIDDRFMMYYRKASGEYSNAEEFANILYENVKEELRIDLSVSIVGEIDSFDDFCTSYVRAVEAYELGKLFAPSANTWLYRNFAVSKILALSDKKILKTTLDSIVKNGSESVWEDEELMTTAEAFITNSLNISETSRVLYIHRNTLMYRLDKIERETGYNLRVFADAVVFKFITVIRTVLSGDN